MAVMGRMCNMSRAIVQDSVRISNIYNMTARKDTQRTEEDTGMEMVMVMAR